MDYSAGKQADKTIAISEHSKRQLTDVYRIDKEKIELIPHGVDTDRFHPCEEQHAAVSDDKTTLLFVGRLGARKGLDLALRSLAQVDDDNLEFVIAGTGRHEDYLSKLVDQFGLSEQVRFLGYVPESELSLLYSSADVFVLPSKYEGFGLVVLEAMSCGTPVIGVSAGGIPTAIGDGDAGIVVDRSVADLANAIREASSPVWREQAHLAALERAQSMSWDHVGQSVDKLYNECLQRTTSTRKS
jgi:glycosyltransferase involved in cell wall biosynthesis